MSILEETRRESSLIGLLYQMLKAEICNVELLGGPKVFHKKASHHPFQHLPRQTRSNIESNQTAG